ncbi:MBL fold metallo-hydrolase domain protein [Candidatus Cyrtobacter comes]|uniref:MBL fold metallo-hydrolase domain protein n=1 Tax=Candidatus Cyrtobacter comes TaxID=675776 RepID=A0ABU5L8N7_9RICK|nr:MBL fold metallo-hydrolase domain protein [Candidatus Cyrtobacter comes]
MEIFDTGAKSVILENNLKKLHIDPALMNYFSQALGS